MTSTLRILHLEDNPDDANLIHSIIESAGIECDFRLVDSSPSFLEALESGVFDLILSDFSLPGLNGSAALAIVREKYPDTPFLFVSGSMGEEDAIESLKQGATDYILKDRLNRLAPCIQRALKEAEERREAQIAREKLHKIDEQNKLLIENLDEIVYIVDVHNSPFSGLLTALTHQVEKILGYTVEEMKNDPTIWFNSIHPDDIETVAALTNEIVTAKIKKTRLYRIKHKTSGEYRWIKDRVTPMLDETGRVIRLFGVARDITEEKYREHELFQAQKMESIGQMAGGIAHDFNNILTVINGYSSLLLETIPENNPIQKDIAQINKAGQRAAALTRQLLGFSRKQIIQPRVINLNTIIDDTEKMLHRLIGDSIQLSTILNPHLENIKADPSQIDQVLMNLSINARDSMPNGGKLVIQTENITIDKNHNPEPALLTPGQYILLTVSDSGTGMDEATKSKIFEPFFTTKEKGKGTGLGLSTVYGIVKQNNGFITVYSEVNVGTTFRIFFPCVKEALSEGKNLSQTQSPLQGSETVFLVEDDPGLRLLAEGILQNNGYSVTTAANGDDAIELAQQISSPINLLLTDVIIPGVSGRELVNRILKHHPEIKVLFMSGYTDDSIVHQGVLDSDVEFLPKPFTHEELLKKVRDVLDGK